LDAFLTCEPVMMMGLRKPESMSDSAEAVYDMVSVPCTTMKASKRSRCSCSSEVYRRKFTLKPNL